MSHVFVSLPRGDAYYPDCTADVFEPGVLTITEERTNAVCGTFGRGMWRTAKVTGADGYALFRFDAASSLATVCAWCPGAAAKAPNAPRAGFGISHTICDGCKQRIEREGAQPF